MDYGYLSHQWAKLRLIFGENTLLMTFVASIGTTTLAILILGGFYLFLDLTGKPSFLVKYKVQPGKNSPVSLEKLWPLLRRVSFNHLVLGSIGSLELHRLMQWRGCSFGPELPSLFNVLLDFLVSIILVEVGFYYSHRLFHHPILYKHVHKKHHEWTSPIAIEAEYCHPLEQLVANMLPLTLGPILMGSHITTVALWYMVSMMSTLQHHCGYHFPLMVSPEFHDFHHLKFNCNYGLLGILDRLHGTDEAFYHDVAYKRHRVLFSLSPMHQLIPDKKKPISIVKRKIK